MSDVVQLKQGVNRINNSVDLINIGQWYWFKATGEAQDCVKNCDPDLEIKRDREYLGCVVELGTNYAKLRMPQSGYGSTSYETWSYRVHFDEFETSCRPAHLWESFIDQKVGDIQTAINGKLEKIKYITSQLGAVDKISPEQTGTAIAVISGTQDPKAFKKALIKAKEETLPAIFDEVNALHRQQSIWLSCRIVRAKAMSNGMEEVVDLIEGQLQSVELYAGLLEEIAHVRKGATANSGTKLHIMQHRCYMDEECVSGYRHGGVVFSTIEGFDKWLSRKENFERLLPFDRTIVAFKVRRKRKHREADTIAQYYINIALAEADETTFLYIRNGENLHRLTTSHDFGEKIFPDRDEFDFSRGRMMRDKGETLITRDDYEVRELELNAKVKSEIDRIWNWRRWERENRILPSGNKSKKKNPFSEGRSYKDPEWDSGLNDLINEISDFKKWEHYDAGSVWFDDVNKRITKEVTDFNRIVLIIQGLFDRSEALHPHPPVKTWTPEGSDAALELIYQDHGIHDGDKPDYGAYVESLIPLIKVGSYVTNQNILWQQKQAEIENKKERRVWKNGYSQYETSNHEYYMPPGNEGPLILAPVEKIRNIKGVPHAMFTWMRKDLREINRGYDNYQSYPDKKDKFWCPISELFNVSGYKPGDFRIFFNDPRTRREYLKWSEILLTAEEWHAGNLNSHGKWQPKNLKTSRWRTASYQHCDDEGELEIEYEGRGSVHVKLDSKSQVKWLERLEKRDDGQRIWHTKNMPKWLLDKIRKAKT